MRLKSYTDINQSRKLAEILPLESTDMVYQSIEDEYGDGEWESIPRNHSLNIGYDDDVPCWSLAALLGVLPDTITSNDGIAFKLNIKKNIIEYSNPSLYLIYKSVESDNLIDVCYKMIIKLHEQKML